MKKLYLLVVILTFIITSGCNNSDDNPAGPSTKGSITGVITDQSTGNGIEGATITTQPATSNVPSDADGHYTISDVEAGDYSVTVTFNGYFPVTTNVTVEASQSATKNVTLSVIPPDPTTSFNYGGTTVTPATINFQNASQNATNYLWDFGDGTTSTEENPAKSYNEMGTYTVKLSASNNVTGKIDVMTKQIVITPGKVFLESVIIDDVPFTDVNGTGWDNGSGPDVYFTFSDTLGNTILNPSTYYENISPSGLPLQWDFSQLEFLDWNQTFYIKVWDYDPIGDDDYIGYTSGLRISQVVNNNYQSTVSLQNMQGTIKVRLILHWQ